MWSSLHPGPSAARAREASLWSHRPGLLGRHTFPREGEVEGLCCPLHCSMNYS
jgi:hypothetical protein